MNDVAFIQQKFGKVGAVLAGDAGDEGGFWSHFKVFFGQSNAFGPNRRFLPKYAQRN